MSEKPSPKRCRRRASSRATPLARSAKALRSRRCAVTEPGSERFSVSDRFRRHLDRAARAFLGADAAALAVIQVELETHAGTELDHGIVGADAVAIVAF